MNVIVLSVSCHRHPQTPLNADVLARDAIRDGTIGHITVTRADTVPSEGQMYRSLAASLDRGLGRVLIVDCACRIQAGLLQAMANAEGTVAVVADPSVDRERSARDDPAHPSTELVLDGDDGHTVNVHYLGCLVLANDDREVLGDVIADGPVAAPWTDVIARLARRTRVGFVVLARDVHESEVIVEKSLAGGSYARTYVRLQPSFAGRVVRKEAHGEGQSKLADEIIWLDRLESIAREHFPVLRGYRIEPSAVSMDLTYHHLPTCGGSSSTVTSTRKRQPPGSGTSSSCSAPSSTRPVIARPRTTMSTARTWIGSQNDCAPAPKHCPTSTSCGPRRRSR